MNYICPVAIMGFRLHCCDVASKWVFSFLLNSFQDTQNCSHEHISTFIMINNSMVSIITAIMSLQKERIWRIIASFERILVKIE